ncbi:MAG: MFS transporter [Pseudomonadota bacterium]
MSDAAIPLTATPTAPSAARERTPLGAWYSLGVLTVITLIAFIDRNILLLQAEVIRKAMGLSDVQLGLLQGTAVAAFTALATFPLGWLADRFDRRLVLGACALFWSAAVVASGMAQTYEQLLLASALVGAGEAGLVPIAYAMIPDMFGEKKRQMANSVFAMASMSASSLAMALCGQVIGMVEVLRPDLPLRLQGLDAWRLGFFAVALPAPIMVLMIATISLRRPAKPAAAPSEPAPEQPGAAPLLPHLKAHRTTFLYFSGGLFSALFGFSAVGAWLAVIYLRMHGVGAKELGAALGVIALVAVLVGFPASVYGTRYFRERIGPGVNVRSLWLTCVLGALAVSLMVFATSARQMFIIHGAYLVTLTAALLVYPTTLQALAPAHLRARTVAVIGMIAAAGGAIAPPVTGFVSDHFKHLPNGLMLSAALVAVPALLLAVFLLARGEKYYVATAEAVRRADAA